MEAAQTTKANPLVSLLAYGDPQHPITGYDSFRAACESNRGKTLGHLVASTVPDVDTGSLSSIDLRDLCLSDLASAETRMSTVNAAYYSKITMGIVAFVSVISLAALLFNLNVLSKLSERILGRLGRKRAIFGVSILVLIGSVSAAMLGWFVRDGGRKPWTVYGLVYPGEVVTPVPINPWVLALFTFTFVAMAVVGIYGIYIVATRRPRFIELLKKGAGIE
jgi:cytochrome d ubiquinol oxidase subunit I